jgi:transposase InsO family protein
VRFEFIRAEKANYPIELLCSALEVSRSGYYAWLDRVPSTRRREDEKLLAEIRASVARGRGAYGSPRVHRDLVARGLRVGRKRVERLMRENGLRGRKRRRYRATTLSTHGLQRHKNVLARQFAVERIDDVWAGDITCIPTTSGWLYLAVVLDLCSRRIVGWAMEQHMREELVIRAMEMALFARSAPRLFHSDQGSQYASIDFQQLLAKHAIKPSMSRRGNCWDNAVVESFFDSMKTELDLSERPLPVDQAKSAVFDYIEVFYNRQRLHSALDYQPPVEFEGALVAA